MQCINVLKVAEGVALPEGIAELFVSSGTENGYTVYVNKRLTVATQDFLDEVAERELYRFAEKLYVARGLSLPPAVGDVFAENGEVADTKYILYTKKDTAA